MAEDRNNSQGLVGQAHTIEHGSSPPAVSTLSTGPNVGIVAGVTTATTKDNPSIQDNSPPRSPRTLLLQRGENGFGFTLRHFIVYPPESCFMLPDHERTKIDEPMDTIFVKQVRENSPAAEAGLRTGDRVVSVDGKPTRGEQYAKVVQRIQQAGPWLRLLVVSKEDDILQRYFGETAHNPETNQRPRLRSPERSGHRQRRSVSMIPGLSPRTRQSWVCSAPSSMPTPLCQDQELTRPLIDDGVSSRDQDFSEEVQQSSESNDKSTQSAKSTIYRSKPSQEIISRYESMEENKVKLRNQPQQLGKDTSNLMQSYDRSDTKYNDKYDHFDRTRSESIYSRTNSDQIYDRIKDPIYEPVRFGESLRTNIDHHSSSHHHHHHHHYHHPPPPHYHHYQQESSQQQQQQQQKQQQSHQHSNLTRVPLSRAEPQVPIYRPASKRISSRRASEGSTSGSMINNFETASYLSTDALRSCEPRSRFGIDSRRDSSSIHVNDPSSYESSSTLVGNEASEGRNENGRNGNLSGHRTNSGTSSTSGINIGNTNIDDSIIMTRLRKSFEQKEEFLRRPSQPIGWFLPEERSESPVRNNNNGTVIPREFYARPQKFQKQVWPPTDSKQDQQLSILKSAQNSNNRTFPGKLVPDKTSSNQNVQRTKSSNDGTEDIDYFTSRNEQIEETSNATHPLEYIHQQIVTPNLCDRLSTPSSCDDNRDSKESDKQHQQQQLQRNIGKSSNFVGTLSRIHENIASVGALLSGERQSIDGRNGASSLPSSPGPEKKMNDKFPILPQGLQIVSKRAKQFESGRLLSDDDEPTGDRTNLYRSELSRLSNKRSVPNVAVRKREFESKAEAQEPRRLPPVSTRETKSLDSETSNSRIIDGEHVQSRIRSNSAESWESTSANNMLETARHHWSRRQDDAERKRNINGNDDGIYVDTTRTSDENAIIVESKGSRSQQQQDDYTQIIKTEHGMLPSDNDTHNNQVVFRRQKNTQIADEDRATRRVSYIKATWGERLHVDSDLESDYEPVIHTSRSGNTREPAVTDIVKDVGQMEREGPLHVKFTVLDGKRSSDRSWKQLWGILRGPILFFYKDRQNQSPSLACDGENVAQSVDVRCSLVDIAEDYTKRKHVLRLANPNAEVLLQTEDAASMALWLRALHEHAAAEKPSEIAQNSTLKQQAVPQTPGPTNSSSPCQMNSVTMAVSTSSGSGSQRLSPLPGHKGIKKLTSFRNRSPTGQSPINKTRKPSQTMDNLVSPKTKTWKGRVAKQLRKMHGQTASPSSPTTQLPPEGATFKVPLELCPPSSFSEYVPLIVEMCTSIVEARGLEVVGIYRVPGNTAAISHLTDSVNKGFENINLQDPRWSDVNVISSLLKSFFRQLPDSLLTAELYPMFIDADKVEDPQRRMTTIRKLLRDLPEHHFATLKYLMFHLKRIVEHSEVNKMEAKNLAIVFGPTLVRASGSRDNMVTMVTDMSHQCRIVESLLNNVDWFFSDDDLDDLSRLSVNLSLPADTSEIETTSSNNHNLLLNNIQKVEGVREMASAKDIVSSIISAANRKIQRRRKCQDETDNETHEVDKPRMKQDTENLQNRRSMALNERQCSVSEIVLMHENQNQSNRSIDRSIDRSDDRSPTLDGIAHASTDDIIADCAITTNRDMLNNHDNVVPSEKSNKYLNRTIESVPSMQSPIHRSTVSSTSESSRLSSETGLSCFDASSTLSSASNDTKQSNDEITIRTYAGLSATTQERIRRFEQETKAMLQRDQNRQRREAERREEERRRIETEWQLAKNEMENDDLLDSIVDTTVMTPTTYLSSATRLSNFNDKSYLDIGSRSTGRVPHLSIAVQQQPTSVRRVSLLSNESATILPQENISDSTIKKLKTDTEQILEGSTLSSIRYGSLDSLHETHEISQSSLSPTNQQRKPLSSDVSDDGSDLLTSLTTTFDRKWRSLVNSSNQTIRGTTMENLSLSDEDAVITQRDSQNLRNQRGGGGGGGLREEKDQEKTTIPQSSFSIESYRDPSLHKMCIEKHQYDRQKNDAPEKDTDSSVTENSSVDRLDDDAIPDNDRSAIARKKIESSKETVYESSPDTNQAQEYCRIEKEASVNLSQSDKVADDAKDLNRRDADSNYSNKLEKFESLTKFEVRSRLKRSESLNKRSENTSSKLKRSESLNKHSVERLSSPTNGKLKRSESLNKHSERSDSPNSKLKRSESLTKTEKTECNISKRRQSVRKDSATKLKRKNGMPERSIKRRHTVGGTKDFDKVHWLDNKLQVEAERVVKNEYRPKKSQLRTSSPDLSTGRIGLTDASFLIEVSFRGPSNVVFNVTNARPQSLPDTSLASKVFKVPLESHV